MAVQDSVPRDPSFYYPSEHCVVRKKERDIEWSWVSETLCEGRVHPSMKESCRVFMDDVCERRPMLKVVANVECGEIVTVAWDNTDE